MPLFFAILSAGIALIAWMYLLTHVMRTGAGPDFMRHARFNVLRGILIAAVLLVVSALPQLNGMIYRDWFILPCIFYLFALPFLWQRIRWISLFPILIGVMLTLTSSFIGSSSAVFWWPFHEEAGKWFQSFTNAFPAAMSPFVGIGFGFLENIRYFLHDNGIGYMIARSLFSLPLHLFATFFGLYCFFVIRIRWIGAFIGIIGASSLHALYNWSLESSILLTIVILICGYMFYGWSLENGWWKRKI